MTTRRRRKDRPVPTIIQVYVPGCRCPDCTAYLVRLGLLPKAVAS